MKISKVYGIQYLSQKGAIEKRNLVVKVGSSGKPFPSDVLDRTITPLLHFLKERKLSQFMQEGTEENLLIWLGSVLNRIVDGAAFTSLSFSLYSFGEDQEIDWSYAGVPGHDIRLSLTAGTWREISEEDYIKRGFPDYAAMRAHKSSAIRSSYNAMNPTLSERRRAASSGAGGGVVMVS